MGKDIFGTLLFANALTSFAEASGLHFLSKKSKSDIRTIIAENDSISLYQFLKNKLSTGEMDHHKVMFTIDKALNIGVRDDAGKFALISLGVSVVCKYYSHYSISSLKKTFGYIFPFIGNKECRPYLFEALLSTKELLDSNVLTQSEKINIITYIKTNFESYIKSFDDMMIGG